MRPPDDFDEFVRARSAALLRIAYVLTGDRGHAEDLLQTVLVRIHRRWRLIGTSADAYARRALVHEATSRWRWRSRRPAERAWLPGEDLAGDDRTDRIAENDSVIRALKRLPARQRAMVALRYLDDLSEADTAAALGCSVGTVKSQTSRGLAKLRELLRNDQTAGSRQ